MPHHFWLKHIETISSYNMLLDLLPATPSETASMTLPITNGSLYSLSKKHRTWNPRNEEIDLNSANAKLIPGKVLAKHMVISGVFFGNLLRAKKWRLTSEAIAKKAFHRRHSVTWMIARMILGALERVPRMFGIYRVKLQDVTSWISIVC